MEKIKTFNSSERQTYVPASVKVIEVASRGVLCTSTEQYNRGTWPGGELD